MLLNAYEIVDRLIIFVNELEGAPSKFSAVKSYSDEDVALPLSKVMVSFHCKENEIMSLLDETTGEYYEHHKTQIAMTCFAPYEDDVVSITKTCEEILSSIFFDFNIKVKGYTVGEIKSDDDLRSFKIKCLIHFDFNTSGV